MDKKPTVNKVSIHNCHSITPNASCQLGSLTDGVSLPIGEAALPPNAGRTLGSQRVNGFHSTKVRI